MVKKLINIGIDMDNTILDWSGAAVKKINKLWPEIDVKELYTVQTGALVQGKLKEIGIELSQKDIYKAICSEGFFLDLEPYERIHETIKFLSTIGNIFIITKPIEWSYVPNEKAQWLKKHLEGIDYNIIFTETSESKGRIDVDLMIDDDPRVYESMAYGRETLFFVPRHKYNMEFQEEHKDNNRIYFIDCFYQIYELLKEEFKEGE